MGTPLESCNFSSYSILPCSAPLRATIIGTGTWTFPSSYGAERNTFGWEHHLKIAISLAIQYFPAPLHSVPQSFVQALEHFPVPTKRSGTLLTMMGTPLEHCNFSSHSLFPRSAPLRATIICTSNWTFPSSYGEERNAFGWEHHLKVAISLAIKYFPAPLCSVPQSFVQALDYFPVPTERSGTLLTMMGTPLEHCNLSSHSLFPRSAPLRATIIGTSTWTFPSSYGVEWNAFGWKHHLKVAFSLAIQYFPAPLCSVPQSLVQALEHFPVPTERSGTLLTMI